MKQTNTKIPLLASIMLDILPTFPIARSTISRPQVFTQYDAFCLDAAEAKRERKRHRKLQTMKKTGTSGRATDTINEAPQ